VTAIQTSEPARTNPRNAQSAGSRQLRTAVFGALTTATAVAVAALAGELAHKSYPTCALLALLLMPFINTLICDRDTRPSKTWTANPPQPTPEHYMPGGGA
jgi:hypothetical protein